MSQACDSLLRHWVAMLWRLPGTCRRRVQLKFCTSSLWIRAEQVMLVHEETYIPITSGHKHARTHTQPHSLTNCSCKPKDGNSTFFFLLIDTKAICLLVFTVHPQKRLFKSAAELSKFVVSAALRLITWLPILVQRLKFHYRSFFRGNLKKCFIYSSHPDISI